MEGRYQHAAQSTDGTPSELRPLPLVVRSRVSQDNCPRLEDSTNIPLTTESNFPGRTETTLPTYDEPSQLIPGYDPFIPDEWVNSFGELESSEVPTEYTPSYPWDNYEGNMTYQTPSTMDVLNEDQDIIDQINGDHESQTIIDSDRDFTLRGVGQSLEAQGGYMDVQAPVPPFIDPTLLQQSPEQQMGSPLNPALIPLHGQIIDSLPSAPWTPESIPEQRYHQHPAPGAAILMDPAGTTYWRYHAGTKVEQESINLTPLPSYKREIYGPPTPPPPQPPQTLRWPHQIPQESIPDHQCGLDAPLDYYPENFGTSSTATVCSLNRSTGGLKKGGRTKGLSPETRRKVHDIRKIRACWRCFFLRNPCSDDHVCDGCRDRSLRMVCDRSRLSDRMPLILPEVIMAQYESARMIDFTNQHVAAWGSASFKFQLTFGYGPPFRLDGVELQPRDTELVRVFQHVTNQQSQSSRLVEKVSPPIGLLAVCHDHLQLEISRYLDIFVSKYLIGWPNACFEEVANVFQKRMLRLVCKYYHHCIENNTSRELLRKTLKLQVLGYIMGRTLTLPEDDDYSNDILGRESVRMLLQNPGSRTYEPETSPRMAMKQLKSVMSSLHKTMFTEVLTELEDMIRHRANDTWGASFCILTLLAMIFEDIQISIDIAIQCENERGRYFMNQAFSREKCQDIDQKVFNWFIEIFHMKYKSRNKRGKIFNPLLHGSSKYELDPQTKWLVDSVARLISEHDTFIRQRRELTDFRPETFPTLNISRLVSAFLLSFYE